MASEDDPPHAAITRSAERPQGASALPFRFTRVEDETRKGGGHDAGAHRYGHLVGTEGVPTLPRCGRFFHGERSRAGSA
ncbi:MAG: hypothetical protein ACREYE_31775 [Gammaproteobacteria bacterium]